jgi:hypothetical protein
VKPLALAAVLALLVGAKAPDPGCSLISGILHAWNLPAGEPIRLSDTIYPGQSELVTDGTLTLALNWSAAYIVERGHGPSLVKMPPGLGDYHVRCIAVAA